MGTGMGEAQILFLTSVSFLGGLSSLWLIGHRLDHVGSKPILALSLAGWLLIAASWMALAGGLPCLWLPVILALQFLMGLSAALIGMANYRLAMATIPAMGRNHFFALYSVFANVSLGLAPILWGLVIDIIGHHRARFLGIEWNHYSVFYLLAALVFGVALVLAGRIHEPKAASWESLLTELMIQSPQRLWLRLWTRD